MHITLWVLQVVTALLFLWSGAVKLFFFDGVSKEVPSFGALPKEVWMTLGGIELVCVVGLILPGTINWKPIITVVAASVLALETLLFVWVHVKYEEITPIIVSIVLGLVMAFIAYGRAVLRPLGKA